MKHDYFLATYRLLITVCVLLLVVGCSGRSDRPATAPVRGKVTYLGVPVADATVAFLAPSAPRIAVGTTDASGNFTLTTFDPDDGAIPGTHVVTVKRYATSVAAAVQPLNSASGPVDPAAIEQAMQQSALATMQAEKLGSSLPAKYGDRKTSDLRLDVVDGENTFDVQLID